MQGAWHGWRAHRMRRDMTPSAAMASGASDRTVSSRDPTVMVS
ncbi:hypothetical protein F8B43_1678 [Methylorubrum populi]|uniref:Uncharacterized protein n=1 Tax=Methylorubrum populi TaxID=223967 RepID=A0A833MYI3_9HYPH|nr:hypothetical protein F8B43_1678 [Methylorubrum populi]